MKINWYIVLAIVIAACLYVAPFNIYWSLSKDFCGGFNTRLENVGCKQ